MRFYKQSIYFSQVKSALTVVGMSNIAQYCKVKTISSPVRKALEKAANLNQLQEMHLAATHNLEGDAKGTCSTI